MGCDTLKIPYSVVLNVFQSTHPSGVRLAWRRNPAGRGSISIHAPQWGATLHTPRCGPLFLIFQSTHPSGVRRNALRVAETKTKFQSTHPSGVRPVGKFLLRFRMGISIHAPQWGATQWPKPCTRPAEFQSTHPSGVRRVTSGTTTILNLISIHAPQWGATKTCLFDYVRDDISIHAPQWGATGGMQP